MGALMESDDSKDAEDGKIEPTETLPHIKRVSRIKHTVLQRYLPVWALILGASNQRLCYFDCYAGRGEYEFQGKRVEGSAPIAVLAAKHYVSGKPGRLMTVILIEKDGTEAEALESCLERFQPYPGGLQVHVVRGDSKALIKEILAQADSLAPSFFMIDPYGHPLSIPLVNRILERPRTEALINLMWYRINMDLSNSLVQHHVDELFGDRSWRTRGLYARDWTQARRELSSVLSLSPEGEVRIPVQDRIRSGRPNVWQPDQILHPACQ